MTCVHLKLLGPCFKTGQMGDRLYTESSAGAAGRRHTTDQTTTHVTPKSQSHRNNQPRIHPHSCNEPTSLDIRTHRVLASESSTRASDDDINPLGALRTQMHRPPQRQHPTRNLAECTRGDRNDGRLNTRQIRRLHPFPLCRFHVLLHSLFKVLFNFPSRYLFAIGLVVVFSLR